jgi:hypothetical protein
MLWTHPFVERLRRARMVAGSWASMHHRGGESNGPEDERIWDQHGKAGVAYRWCCTSLPDFHILPRKCKFSTESAIQTCFHPAVCRHPVAVFAWEQQHLENLRRKDLLPRLRNDRATCLLCQLFRLGLRRFCWNHHDVLSGQAHDDGEAFLESNNAS